MKTGRLSFIVILSLTVLLLIGGCATTEKVTKPTTYRSGDTLLVGRIKIDCRDFPRDWRINGEHTMGLRVYFVDPKTKKVVKVASRGNYGVFELVDPVASQYIITGFTFIHKSGNRTFNDSYPIKNTYINITKNSVNNLGDIIWYEKFTGQEKRGGGSSTFQRAGIHKFKLNYDEVESWYRNTHPESSWNERNWVDVEYLKF